MPAFSNKFPWPSHYGHFKFFEERMVEHARVAALQRKGSGAYEIELEGERTLKAFICECYSFGVAEYEEVARHLGGIDVIIINSNWCGYTMEAKRHCRDKGVGLFDIGELMAALNKQKYWEHLTDREKEHFEEKNWV